MIFHIAICSPDGALRSRLEHQCMEFFARREDACIVEQLQGPDALLQQDAAGLRYELYLIELAAVARPEGLTAAAELRRRGRRAPLAFVARTPAHAYSAYRVDAMQYLLQPVHQPEVSALLKRAVEPEYGPTLTVTTADGVRALTYAEIEYLECTHHIVHFHLTTGEDVASLSLRVPFSAVAQPLLADGRFVQPHRSYVVNLEAVQLLAPGEVRMRSGARIPIPRGREAAVREAFCLMIYSSLCRGFLRRACFWGLRRGFLREGSGWTEASFRRDIASSKAPCRLSEGTPLSEKANRNL